MLLLSPILRKPKESEMSLSNQVKDSIQQAGDCLRDALAFTDLEYRLWPVAVATAIG